MLSAPISSDTLDTVHVLAIKLPQFYIKDPSGWFEQAEAQFGIGSIMADDIKYWYIHVASDMKTSSRTVSFLVKAFNPNQDQ